MRSLILSFFVTAGLVGCTANQPPLIDCQNGYYVNPPLACPEQGISK
jgi:hypothetical protein